MASLVVATFNIRNGRALDGRHAWPFRRAAVLATIRSLAADVVGLQEVYAFQRHYLERRLPHTDWVGDGRNGAGRGEQCPLVHRTARFERLSHITRWFGDEPARPTRQPEARFPRIITMGTYRDIATGRHLVVANTHLDERRPGLRVRSATQLVGWLPPGVPTVVLGDLNTDDDSVLGPFADHGLVRALPTDAPGTAHAFRGGEDGERLDHVLVSGDLRVLDARVVTDRPAGRLPSDHWPVRVELAWISA